MTTPAENKALVREYFEEIGAGNIEIIDELFAEEFTTGTEVVRSDIEADGRTVLKAAWREFFAAFPDIETVSQELVAEDDRVAFIQVWRGTHEGTFRGIDPTGNEVTHEMWGRYVIEDGQIVHGDAQVDNFGRFRQLGLALSIEGYRTLIDTAPDPIFIADIDTGEIIETNEAAEALLEQPREEILGRRQWELHPDDHDYEALFAEGASRARERPVELSGFPDGSDVQLVRADGSRVPVEINGQVVRLSEGPTLVSIYRDVSGRQRRKQRLQVLNRILRHNLRNDLGVIEGLADQLAADLEGEAAGSAQTIRQTARQLADLGEKARGVERIRAAEAALAAPVSVRAVVTDAVTDDRVVVDVPADLSVVTVREALVLIVENLVENALEHGTDSSDDTSVSVRGASTADGVELVVADDGPGIPDHELDVIEEGWETPLEHGSGIGLWLVHWAVDAIRGSLAFETDDGTRVTVTVPSLDELSD